MKMTIEIRKENGLNAVSARDLHEKLEITDRFNRWFERMVAYGFVENEDFCRVKSSTQQNQYGGEKEIYDYAISLDMAKEICMIQRSDIGRKFRQYFIECEKELNRKTETYVPRISKEELEARKKEAEAKSKELRLEVYDRLHSLANEYAERSKDYQQILDAHATKELTGEFLLPLPGTEKTYSATEIGEMFGISANKVRKIANANGMKTDVYGKYFIDKSRFSDKEVQTFRYNSRAIDRIRQILKEVGK